MHTFKEFLDSLDTTGGHIFIFLLIMLFCGGGMLFLHLRGNPASHDIGVFVAGTLFPTFFAILKGTGKANGQRPAGTLTRATDPPQGWRDPTIGSRESDLNGKRPE